MNLSGDVGPFGGLKGLWIGPESVAPWCDTTCVTAT
jgi:hypothetical protein